MYRILLLDDEQNVLNALRRELQDECELEMFSNPADALQRCHEAQFDLVIADYKMPDMNGIQFLMQLGKLQPDAIRIVLSGHADADVLANAINDTHIYRFINKPWDQAELASTIAQALTYRKVLMDNRRLAEAARNLDRPALTMTEKERRYQILVVDDEPNVLSAVVRDLTSRSAFQELHMALLHEADADFPASSMDLRFEVYATASPLQALEYARRVTCDAVVADFLMPEMTGIQFLEIFRKEHPDVARIILSGHTDKHMLSEAINRLEISGFLAKPWREYELKNTLAQAITCKGLRLYNRQLAQQCG